LRWIPVFAVDMTLDVYADAMPTLRQKAFCRAAKAAVQIKHEGLFHDRIADFDFLSHDFVSACVDG
jgi:hypothetical protein